MPFWGTGLRLQGAGTSEHWQGLWYKVEEQLDRQDRDHEDLLRSDQNPFLYLKQRGKAVAMNVLLRITNSMNTFELSPHLLGCSANYNSETPKNNPGARGLKTFCAIETSNQSLQSQRMSSLEAIPPNL